MCGAWVYLADDETPGKVTEPAGRGPIKQGRNLMPMNTLVHTNPLVLEGNFYHDGRIVGRIKSAVLLPLHREELLSQADSLDIRVRYLLTIDRYFTVHTGPSSEKFEVDSGSQRMRVYPEDSQSVGGETDITVTLEE